ncbi:MAG: glycosyltransferase family 4 protein [Phycisphaerales bacterium JB060]
MLLISREYPPFIGGGIGTYTVRMARALAGQGREPVVVTVGDCDEPTVEEDPGVRDVRVVRLPFLNHADGQPDWAGPRDSILASASGPACHAAFWAFHRESVLAMQLREHLPWLIETFAPPAIEAPDTGALLWFILNERRLGRGPLAERGADGPPVIVHLHSPTAWIEQLQGGPQAGRAMAELRSMERDVLRWADGVACPSRALAEWTRAWEPDAVDISVTPYPLGEAVDEDAPMPSGAEMLFVGRMERRKGFDTLAEAIGRLGEAAPPLRIAGRDTFDWVEGAMFGATVLRTHCQGRDVRALGELTPEALAEERRGCAIAVVPSPNDNYPNTCMEAMAAGQVTVAARGGGMAEMIEDGVSGLLFEPGDADDLARVLGAAAAMSTDARRAMGRAGRDRISTICDDRAVVEARLGHAGRLRPDRPSGKADREVALVAFTPVGEELRAALTAALRANTAVDAVAPWFERVGPDGREVVAFSTPSAEQPRLLVEHPGPLAIDADWWRRMEGEGVGGGAPAILAGLVERGAAVAVLPDLIAPGALPIHDDSPGTPIVERLTDAERAINNGHARLDEMQRLLRSTEMNRDAAAAQLRDIQRSRAYRLAQILSVLRRKMLGGP